MASAIVLALGWVAWSVHDGYVARRAPGDGAWPAAEMAFEDGHYREAEGRYREALADCERALGLEPAVAEGPGRLTRLLRLQPADPPTVADRARYLRAGLAEPQGEWLLRVPEADAGRRPCRQQAPGGRRYASGVSPGAPASARSRATSSR